MIEIPIELTNNFLEDKYPMGTGSDEWWDIKTDFELEGDAVMGAVFSASSDQPVEKGVIVNFNSNLEKFKVRLDNYTPKDEEEAKEKEKILRRVNNGLEIYKLILNHLSQNPSH